MKKLLITKLLICILVLSNATVIFSQAKTGEKAPSMSVEEWLKGEPVTGFENGKVYLVEFWGTWCSPCIKNIPKLSELQKKYSSQDLIVIGVATHEFKDKSNLVAFMNENDAAMQYRVAYDTDLSMERDWDTGKSGGNDFKLPVCFLVDRTGEVIFVGHPEDQELMSALDKAIGDK